MIIKNNSESIKKYLEKSVKEVYQIKHIGNFIFEVTTTLGTIKIIAEPVNEEKIKILSAKLV
jgi:hypothetical protein